MVKKIIIIILLIIPGIASAADWDNAAFVLSYENPVITKGDYTLKVVDFDGYGTVSLNVSRNGVFLGGALLKTNDTDWDYMDSGRIRLKGVNITDITVMPTFGSTYSPEAEIIFAIEKSSEDDPFLAVSISTDREEYLLDHEIIATVKVRNIGEGNADDIRLGINSDGLLTQGDLPSGFSLEDGTYKSWEIRFTFPATLLKGVYNISVNASWNNPHAARGFAESSKTVQVKMPLEVLKTTTSETKLGKPAYVSLNVENIQSRPVMVRLIDALPMFFSLNKSTVTDNKSDLNWEFVLSPHERNVLSYWMNPEQIGAHRVPEAHATWTLWGEYYTNSSEPDNSESGSGNIIAVYRGLSYKEQDFNKQEFPDASPDNTIEVLSGGGISNLLNDSGPKVSLSATIRPVVSIEVTPDTLYFGKIAPGGTSDKNNITIKNRGASNISVTANVTDNAGNLYVDGLYLDDALWKQFSTILKNEPEIASAALKVPEKYEGAGRKNGTLMFWAEETD
jgi:hypothetical protein